MAVAFISLEAMFLCCFWLELRADRGRRPSLAPLSNLRIQHVRDMSGTCYHGDESLQLYNWHVSILPVI